MPVASAATKVGPKFQVRIPKNVRDAVGLKVGDLVEASVGRDGIVLRQKVRSDKPVSLARQLEESEAAVRAGRVLGPFTSAGAAMKAVKAHARRADRTVAVYLIASPPEVQKAFGKQPGSTTTGGCTSPSRATPTCCERSRLTRSSSRAQPCSDRTSRPTLSSRKISR